MKKILQYILAASVIAFFGCEEEYEQPSDTPSNVHVTTGSGNGTPIVQINGFESFADLSIGVKSRLWTFPGGDITEIETSKEDVLQVYFYKVGNYDVNLSIDFLDNPYDWRTQSFRSSSKVDTTINVTVVDSVDAEFKVYYIAIDGSDSTELTLQDGALNELMAGESIRIKQTSGGAPTIWEYTSEGASPAFTQITEGPDHIAEIKYKRLGNYDLAFKPYRTKPQGSDLIELKDFIKVIPSTRPVVLEEVYRFDESTVGLSFSRSIANPTSEEGNFTVQVKNTVISNLGIPTAFDESLVINEVTVADGDNDNVVLLKLGDNLYTSDTVRVSYTGGNIQSTDGITVGAFSDELLDFQLVNLAAEYGSFENNGAGWMQMNEVRTEAGQGQFEFSFDRVFHGSQSLKLSTTRNAEGIAQWIEVVTDVDLTAADAADAYNSVAVEEGDKFYISYQTYVETTDPISADVWEACDMYLWLMWDKLKVHEYRLGTEPRYPIGQWNKIEGVWGGNSGAVSSAVLRPYFRSIGNITLFIDDLQIYEYESRPFAN
ncbi:MAG: hypothetical protein JXR10_12900 [Cyclobacteriaceae bacterium]